MFVPSHFIALWLTMGAMARHQRGYIYEAFNALHVRYWSTEIVDGKPVRKQRSHRLCEKDRSKGFGSPSAMAVRSKCEEFMRSINERENAQSPTQDMMVVTFWTSVYLPIAKKSRQSQAAHVSNALR